jgi:hypothetical protein
MNSNDFTTAERIVSTVTSTVGDSGFKNGFSKGWYMSHVQQAMQSISVESKWAKIIKDYAVPTNFQLKLPANSFDLREIYLYQGTLCNPTKTQVVHWKRLFNNMPNGEGYTARIKDDGSNSGDPFLPNQSTPFVDYQGNYSGTKFYYNIANGVLMLSQDCASYPFIRIVMNSFGGEIGGEIMVPRMFERAIQDYLEERYYNAMKARNPRTFRILWSDAYSMLSSPTGAWKTAVRNVKSMDQAQKESINEYISSQFHK